MRATEFITELDVNQYYNFPNRKAWSINRGPGKPSSDLFIYREGTKVRIDAKVGGRYTKHEDAEYASDVIPLMRAWKRTVISELPQFIRPDDTSIRIEAQGKKIGIYSRVMPEILKVLQKVNPGWYYNGSRYLEDIEIMLFTFTNYNYNRPMENWIDKR
jgi:hypothetical protein